MKLYSLPLVLLLASCDASPITFERPPASPNTWGEAEYVWADAWCRHSSGCYPDQFLVRFGDEETCLLWVTELNCADKDCESTFPLERIDPLDECFEQMGKLLCLDARTPISCLKALVY